MRYGGSPADTIELEDWSAAADAIHTERKIESLAGSVDDKYISSLSEQFQEFLGNDPRQDLINRTLAEFDGM